jgi:rRNA maturation endonuclease Nob1
MTQSTSQNVTKEMNIELLNVINEDVENVNKWSKMPPISDELYNELVKEFNNNSYYFFN